MGLMTANDVQLLNTRVGAMPATAATHGTAVYAVQPATADPDRPCLEATATHMLGRPLLLK